MVAVVGIVAYSNSFAVPFTFDDDRLYLPSTGIFLAVVAAAVSLLGAPLLGARHLWILGTSGFLLALPEFWWSPWPLLAILATKNGETRYGFGVTTRLRRR
ncbi:MAG TPA: hypothetical protein DDY22_16365 [Geobacter sp.]|nr:hypothetical protein [Geobacter sp.]